MLDDELVKVRRSYFDRLVVLLFGMLMLFGAVSIVYTAVTTDIGWVGLLLFAGAMAFGLALGGQLVRHAVLPFRVDVDSHGWSLRTPKLNHHLRWDEVDAVVLADAPANAGQRIPAGPRLLLVPAVGVGLGVPLPEEVDGQAAIELFQLDEVACTEDQLVRDVTVLAGDRFHDLRRRPIPPADGIPLRRFPDEPDSARLTRWLDRRQALLFVGWYLLVLVPTLTLIVWAAQRSELLGVIVLVVSLVTIGTVTSKVRATVDCCRDLVDRAESINGADLVINLEILSGRTSLHSGIVSVLPPGSLKGFGKAWLLTQSADDGVPNPILLLSDPRTGRVRSRDDLQTLEAVLRVAPDERSRAAGRQLEELAVQASASALSPHTPSSEAPPASAYATALWQASKGVGRAVVLLGVPVTVAIAGGWVVENSAFVGPALIIAAVCLFGIWIFYALYRVLRLLGALFAIVARMFR
ncbi:hypothetical protein [Micromonospora chokoriensis]|uniref:hypothetical protein n=1 Tax=Micromonospora chokoriensis TaxID=356851 RepID=UPI0004C42F12|nr:hypothetical protein [Micromonospora chokoriensis]